MNTHATNYFIMTVICIVNTYTKESQVIHDIGSQLCPHTSFCQRNATPYSSTLFRRPCCSDCSCEANCWETANCCPDQEVRHHPEPVPKCRTSVVKAGIGFPLETWGYRVIDYCPVTEKNVSLVASCITDNSRDLVDFIWVSDDVSGKVYQNRFCAECNHVTNNVTEWPLVAQCTEDIYKNKDNWKSFLLSNQCQLLNKQPYDSNVTGCAVPKFTTCNQTGLWQNFDADVQWACEIFEAVFFVRKSTGRGEDMDTYRNAYCYACNIDTVENIETICPGRSFNPPGVTVFTSLIDHRRYEYVEERNLKSETTCRINEIMDNVMNKCRLLKCPFGSTPVNGECKPLFVGTVGLYIDVRFALSVIWSRLEYRMTDATSKLRALGKNVIDQFLDEARFERIEAQCPHCYLELQMTADISKHSVRSVKGNDVNDDVTDTSFDVREDKTGDGVNHGTKDDASNVTLENEGNDVPAFVLKVVLFTVADCQLQDIFDIASDTFGKVINVSQVDGETEMQLKVGLFKDNIASLNQTRRLKKVHTNILECKVKGAHRLKDETSCSKIPITYNEFVPHLTNENEALISSFFQKEHIETGEAIEVCVDTYYERLQSIDFQMLSQGSVVVIDTCLCTVLIFRILLLR